MKIDAENVLFLNFDFFGFRPRSWCLLGFQLGAKLAILPTHEFRDLPVWTLLSERSQKNTVLEASGLDFGGPGPRCWTLQVSTWTFQSPAESQQMSPGANMLWKKHFFQKLLFPRVSRCPKPERRPQNVKISPNAAMHQGRRHGCGLIHSEIPIGPSLLFWDSFPTFSFIDNACTINQVPGIP